MRNVVFDTETNGLFVTGKPAPRLASIALLFLDKNFDVEHESLVYVYPKNWNMTHGATRVNKITDAMLRDRGIEISRVLQAWNLLVDQKVRFIAHNLAFDFKVMRSELVRAGMPSRDWELNGVCTMKAMTPVCGLPGRHGYKWPTLREAYGHFFRESFMAHEALSDARACAAVFKELRARGYYNEV
jgi:DNA polymerase III epsilon subunit-like protein